MILDTCFLIDLQREFRKGEAGRATRFLELNPSCIFKISVISATEFLEGFENFSDGERFLRAYARVDVDSTVATHAAAIRRHLRLRGELISDFDILIAATAIAEEVPLVTRNTDHFKRLSGIEIVAY